MNSEKTFTGNVKSFVDLLLYTVFCVLKIIPKLEIMYLGNDQEVKFHGIEIHFFRRSNYFLIMRSNFFGTFHEVKIPNNYLTPLITAFFMRSKFKKSIIGEF
jgi:hypothetical protein